MSRFFDLLPLRSRDSVIDGGEGNTRCLHARELGRALGLDRLWVKVESDNPTRTTKDRQGTVVTAALREFGVERMVTASTGNSCTAVARILARYPELELHVFVGREFLTRVAHPGTPNVKLYWLPEGTYVDACVAADWYAREAGLERDAGFFFLAKREALKTAYLEAALQLTEEVEVYLQGVSSGVGVHASHRAARHLCDLGLKRALPRLVCVQERTCDPMVRSFARGVTSLHPEDVVERPRGLALATHRGDPSRSYAHVREAVLSTDGTMVSVEADAIEAARALARETEGLDICYTSAMTIAAAGELRRTDRVRSNALVLLNLTGADREPSKRTPDFLVHRQGDAWSVAVERSAEGGRRKHEAPAQNRVVDSVVDVLRESQGLRDDLQLDARTVLLEQGLALDSVAVLELLLALEQRFDLSIAEHEITTENLRTVGALAELLQHKLGRSSDV